jgi:hypothetical protein
VSQETCHRTGVDAYESGGVSRLDQLFAGLSLFAKTNADEGQLLHAWLSQIDF